MYEEVKNILYNYYQKNHGLGRKHILERFRGMGAPERTLINWLKLLEEGKTLTRKKGSGTNFVEKADNPANCPKVRPIEDLWGILKQKVYENDWHASTIKQLKARIGFCIRNLDKLLVQRTLGSTHGRLDYVRRHGYEKL